MLLLPSGVVPSRNWTAPPGVPVLPPLSATCAVNVTDCPTVDGLASETRLVLVVPFT